MVTVSSEIPKTVMAPPRVSPVIYAGFVGTGAVTTLLGPVLPVLISRWALSDAQAGALFTAQFGGSMLGVLLSNHLVPRLGFHRSLALSFGLMALGVAGLTTSVWAVGLALVAVYGVGLGLNIPATNLLVSEAHLARPSAALNFLNFLWGAGAVTCPPLIALLMMRGRASVGLLILAGLLAVMGIWVAWEPTAPRSGRRETAEAYASDPPPNVAFLLLLGALFFLYVGTENGLSGWVAAYARRLGTTRGVPWELAPSFFWGALLLGRASAPGFLRFASDARIMGAGLVTAALGVLTLIVTPSSWLVFVGVSLSGLGLAAVFPITIAMLARGFGPEASRRAGWLFALGGLGGATLPWLVGFLSTEFGTLRAGLAVPLLATFAMTILHLYSHRWSTVHSSRG